MLVFILLLSFIIIIISYPQTPQMEPEISRNNTLEVASVCVLSFQLCPALCNPMHCRPPGFSVHGILQASILEWVAMPSSRGSSQPQGSNPCLLHPLLWQAGSLPLVLPGKTICIIGIPSIITTKQKNNLSLGATVTSHWPQNLLRTFMLTYTISDGKDDGIHEKKGRVCLGKMAHYLH